MVFTFKNSTAKMSIGKSLEYCLSRAAQDGRVQKGVYECVQALESDPNKVMCCLLAEDYAQDVTSHIHFVLLGAFCLEQGIPVIKFDQADKVNQILSKKTEKSTATERDFSCVLIELPEGDALSPNDSEVLAYSEDWKQYDPPVVELP